MPAAAGNHPGHQPGTTQARHVTGQGQLPCAHKGPNFVSVTTAPGNAGPRRTSQTPISLWTALTRPSATLSDETGMHGKEKVYGSIP